MYDLCSYPISIHCLSAPWTSKEERKDVVPFHFFFFFEVVLGNKVELHWASHGGWWCSHALWIYRGRFYKLMLLQANIALLLSRALQQESTAAEIWACFLLWNRLPHPLTMAIKSLFFEKQNVSFVCQWQHMLPAFQNSSEVFRTTAFLGEKVVLINTMRSKFCLAGRTWCPVRVMFSIFRCSWYFEACHTLKCWCIGGIYLCLVMNGT